MDADVTAGPVQESLIRNRRLLDQTKTLMREAHSRGDIALELYLMTVEQKLRTLQNATCVVIFTAKLLSQPLRIDHLGTSGQVIAQIYYKRGTVQQGEASGATTGFGMALHGQAWETARDLPLRKGDWIRCVGKFVTTNWFWNMQLFGKAIVITRHVELIRQGAANRIADKEQAKAADSQETPNGVSQ